MRNRTVVQSESQMSVALAFLELTGSSFCSLSSSGFVFECCAVPKCPASLISRKRIRSETAEWRWGRDTAATPSLLGALTRGSGQWAVGMTAGSWCGRMPLDSGLSVEFLFIGDGGAPSLIHLLPLFCCEFKAVA